MRSVVPFLEPSGPRATDGGCRGSARGTVVHPPQGTLGSVLSLLGELFSWPLHRRRSRGARGQVGPCVIYRDTPLPPCIPFHVIGSATALKVAPGKPWTPC